MNKTYVIYHSEDYDGIACREVAKRSLGPNAIYVGWNYGDPTPLKAELTPQDDLYMLDISVADLMEHPRLIWIDHHKSAIEKWGSGVPRNGGIASIAGLRIDGVAACRLAWAWFYGCATERKENFVNRTVIEPYALTLIGEWDIWDQRDVNAAKLQYGLDSVREPDWSRLFSLVDHTSLNEVRTLCERGEAAKAVIEKRNADIMRERSFSVTWEGLRLLCCNFVRCNSTSFAAGIKPEHDACCSFYYDGRNWNVSLYHVPHKTNIDLSEVAVKYGGGGHRGACGFRWPEVPFIHSPAKARVKQLEDSLHIHKLSIDTLCARDQAMLGLRNDLQAIVTKLEAERCKAGS